MIKIDEIRSIAGKLSLTNNVVEKDYALGWLLWGIFHHPVSGKDWIFKGGTCLKKCYLETYRFSEDLDFSCLGKHKYTSDTLTKILEEISDLIYNEAGIEFPKKSIYFELFNNPRGSISIQGGIKYRGPVRPQVGIAQMPRIKLDITLDEPVILSPVVKTVEHKYSDCPHEGISILCYDYEEIFAEKIRALAQRLRPRDLYDVVHLFHDKQFRARRELVYSTLISKCTIREIEVPTIKTIQNHENRNFLASEWETQLKHQVSKLPSFETFLNELPALFDWLGDKK